MQQILKAVSPSQTIIPKDTRGPLCVSDFTLIVKQSCNEIVKSRICEVGEGQFTLVSPYMQIPKLYFC